ncbi:hypothetical protein Lal_00033785 [Lupinus albus]|nr:hypothetical protein Lal_00033785 [Lupinus albus]
MRTQQQEQLMQINLPQVLHNNHFPFPFHFHQKSFQPRRWGIWKSWIEVQAATKPNFATIFPYVLQAPDWIPPFDLECNIVVYALGTVVTTQNSNLEILFLI